MIGDFLDARNQAAQMIGAKFRSLNQITLLEALAQLDGVSLAGATLSKFLSGVANTGGKRDWYAIAPRLLRYVLGGTADDLDPPHTEVVSRILEFFFPRGFKPGDVEGDRNQTWFFHPRLRRFETPATVPEVHAEMRAIAFHCAEHAPVRGRGRIICASGELPFPYVNARGELSETGKMMLGCLRAGVQVVFAFPRCGNPPGGAELSAQKFAEVAAKHLDRTSDAIPNLALIGVNPGELKVREDGGRLWAGEYLARCLRFTFYKWEPADPAPATGHPGGWSLLTVARDAPWGPSAYQTDQDDVAAFESWQRVFVGDIRSARPPGEVPSGAATNRQDRTRGRTAERDKEHAPSAASARRRESVSS